jgi:hypothetical protein
VLDEHYRKAEDVTDGRAHSIRGRPALIVALQIAFIIMWLAVNQA